jgi:hypothetical protein
LNSFLGCFDVFGPNASIIEGYVEVFQAFLHFPRRVGSFPVLLFEVFIG